MRSLQIPDIEEVPAMLERRRWLDREFALGTPVESQSEILERLRGTPLRLEERMGEVPPDAAVRRPPGAWSILEHAGHLSDLEPLWLGRLDDLLARAEALRPADLENRATWAANHNARPPAEILAEFRERRMRLVARLERLVRAQLEMSARHPRLEQSMTVVDVCFFAAEHDDHHLATITELRRGR